MIKIEQKLRLTPLPFCSILVTFFNLLKTVQKQRLTRHCQLGYMPFLTVFKKLKSGQNRAKW